MRVGPKNSALALRQPHTRLFDMAGRPMAGWIIVEPEGFATDEDLKAWIQQGIDFVYSLPKKE